MLYEVKFFMDNVDTHYAKVDQDGLDYIRMNIDEDTTTDFIEVYCYTDESTFAINRKKVNAFSYAEEDDE